MYVVYVVYIIYYRALQKGPKRTYVPLAALDSYYYNLGSIDVIGPTKHHHPFRMYRLVAMPPAPSSPISPVNFLDYQSAFLPCRPSIQPLYRIPANSLVSHRQLVASFLFITYLQ